MCVKRCHNLRSSAPEFRPRNKITYNYLCILRKNGTKTRLNYQIRLQIAASTFTLENWYSLLRNFSTYLKLKRQCNSS